MKRLFANSIPGDIYELVTKSRHFGRYVIRTFDRTVYNCDFLRVDNYDVFTEKKGLCTGVIRETDVLQYLGHNSKYSIFAQ